jgi:hypothetical protein
MNARKVNRAFLISMVLYTGCVFGLSRLLPGIFSNLILNNLICEGLMVIPGLLFAVFSGERLTQFLHLKKIRPGTALMMVPFTLLSMSVITLVNLLSQFFVDNTAAAMMEGYGAANLPAFQLLFSMGIFAPLCEETACRGVFYRGYRKNASAFGAMLLSALLFAIMHMNINQAMYAFVMGIIAVLVVEATGSLWASILYHGVINGSQVLLMYGMLRANPSAYSEAAAAVNADMLIYALAGYLIITAITLPVAWAMLVWMSGHEGRRGALSAIWKERKKDKLVTVPLVLALILCALIMIITAAAPLLIKWMNR